MPAIEKVNIVLVDDQPAKLLSYQVVLQPLGENLIPVTSGREALACLLSRDVAVVLIDIEMPDMNGFELAATIREHPRFEKTAIIFVSAVHLADADTLRGYKMGAVDYVSVPVKPEILRAKVQVFVDLYRKSRELEHLTEILEQRVEERTAELRAAVDQQAILAREVDHRAKNALTVVQSIVRLTHASTIGEYVKAIEGRIDALARSHVLLSKSQWKGADLREILQKELAPFTTSEKGRLTIEGPTFLLKPSATQNLTLIIHELATNAVKYGSLSTEKGRLAVEFEILPEKLVLKWLEYDGPKIRKMNKSGFGTKLIAAGMKNLEGVAEFDWAEEGLKCKLILPAEGKPENAFESTPGKVNGSAISNGTPTALLVEDEPLVAMMMADLLSDLKFTVLGPFASVQEATVAIDKGRLRLALLDINLRGEMVYPVAAKLREQGVPFIFMTGYAPEVVSKEFAEIPILKKPVDQELLHKTIQRITAESIN